MRVPTSAFGRARGSPLLRISRRELRARAVHRRHRGVAETCEYVSDFHVVSQAGLLQHPAAFENCAAAIARTFALWAGASWQSSASDAELCVGRVILWRSAEIDRQHAWVVYRVNGTEFLFEPAAPDAIER